MAQDVATWWRGVNDHLDEARWGWMEMPYAPTVAQAKLMRAALLLIHYGHAETSDAVQVLLFARAQLGQEMRHSASKQK